jgi:hypothetical protein
MRALVLSCALLTALAVPAAAEGAHFLKVDVIHKSGLHHENGPGEIHVRMPISLAKGLLDMAGSGDVQIHGKHMKGVKVEELEKLIQAAKPGDLLLEITTDKGDLVKVTVE